MDRFQHIDMWRNIDGGMVCALAKAFGNLVLPKPDLSRVPPLEVEGVSSLVTPGPVAPHQVLIDHAVQSTGVLFTHVSDYSVTLVMTDGSRNFLAHLTSFFSKKGLMTELERFTVNGEPSGEGDYRVGLFVGRFAPPGAIRSVVDAVRRSGLGEFLAVRTGLVGNHTIALEGEGRIVIAPIEDYIERFFDVYHRPHGGVDPFDGFGV